MDEDAKALAQFHLAIREPHRALSLTKYLIGEPRHHPLGGARQPSRARRDLAQRHRADFVGARFRNAAVRPGHDLSYELYLPSYAATAFAYHKAIPAPANMGAFRRKSAAMRWATTPPRSRRRRGAAGGPQGCRRQTIVAVYRALRDYLVRRTCAEPAPVYGRARRSRGLVTGRLDSALLRPAARSLTENAPGDPQSNAVTGYVYRRGQRAYLRGELRSSTHRTAM